MILSVRDITIDLGQKPQKRILDHVSFDALDGEFLSLLGASGAGKSTLLKIIAGILIQDKGSIVFGEEAVDGLPAHKRKVGFVFQDMRLFPNMSVEQNVAFPCKMARMPKKERLERARYLLECVHLEELASRDVSSLSGGQQQRVALARALAGQPRILLLDEPFSGLDEHLRDEMRSLVLKLHRDFKITTIMVTHDAIEALEMSDRVVYISEGKIVQSGTPEEIFSAPASHEIASCFGECSILNGVVEKGLFRRGPLTLPAPDCPHGPARAIARYQGASLTQDAASTLTVRCSVYRGNGYLIRLDADQETLTIPSERDFSPGTTVAVDIPTQSLFIYPQGDGSND